MQPDCHPRRWPSTVCDGRGALTDAAVEQSARGGIACAPTCDAHSSAAYSVAECKPTLHTFGVLPLIDQPASLNGSLFSSKRDRKIAASIGSLKQYRTYAAHSSSTYMSNLPAYDSRKFTISLSLVSCRRGSTTWYGHSASSFCSQALRFVRVPGYLFSVSDSEINCSLLVPISVKRLQMRVADMVNTSLKAGSAATPAGRIRLP
jgi:hypothetical protein